MNFLNMPGFLPHRIACFLLSVGLITPLMAAQAGAEVVGEVTLLIGQAQLVGADDVVRTVERGQSVRAGDRIETREGGHVHVRFVDGGRLSVRPASRLQIENYSHSASKAPTLWSSRTPMSLQRRSIQARSCWRLWMTAQLLWVPARKGVKNSCLPT